MYHCYCTFVVGKGGFEPPKSETTDLQSAPFGHSGISPYSSSALRFRRTLDYYTPSGAKSQEVFANFRFSAQKSRYSRRRPSTVTVTTCHGMNFPLACSAVRAACSSPPQHGTSIRTTVTLWILLERMISVSFSA